jgi:hypothetical protein
MKEVFREIEGFDGYYVSNKGTVKFLRRLKSGKFSERFLTLDPDKYSVRLSRPDGSYRSVKVAILVADAFIQEPSKGRRRVRHKDGNEMNNYVNNLEWDGINREDVVEIRRMLEEGYSMGEVSRKYNINRTHVRRIKDNEVWVDVK